MTQVIREATLRELIEAGSVASAAAVGQHGGFFVSVQCGRTRRVLANARGGIRLFSNLTSLATYLRRLGVSGFAVDTRQYSAGRVRRPRPDRAEALKHTRTKPRQGELLAG